MFGGYLQSVAALLVCIAASREGERVGIFNFALSPSESPGARSGGWGFRWISTIDGGAYGMHTSGSGGQAC